MPTESDTRARSPGAGRDADDRRSGLMAPNRLGVVFRAGLNRPAVFAHKAGMTPPLPRPCPPTFFASARPTGTSSAEPRR
jgi:hypothetical protein